MLYASGPISKVGGCLAEEGEEIYMKGGLQVLQPPPLPVPVSANESTNTICAVLMYVRFFFTSLDYIFMQETRCIE